MLYRLNYNTPHLDGVFFVTKMLACADGGDKRRRCYDNATTQCDGLMWLQRLTGRRHAHSLNTFRSSFTS